MRRGQELMGQSHQSSRPLISARILAVVVGRVEMRTRYLVCIKASDFRLVRAIVVTMDMDSQGASILRRLNIPNTTKSIRNKMPVREGHSVLSDVSSTLALPDGIERVLTME